MIVGWEKDEFVPSETYMTTLSQYLKILEK